MHPAPRRRPQFVQHRWERTLSKPMAAPRWERYGLNSSWCKGGSNLGRPFFLGPRTSDVRRQTSDCGLELQTADLGSLDLAESFPADRFCSARGDRVRGTSPPLARE